MFSSTEPHSLEALADQTPPRGLGEPLGHARVKTTPSDFKVEEQLGFDLDGEGSHVWLELRKTGANTQWVAGQLARFAGVRPVDIGYAGLKDRHAVTTQWFSVNLAGKPEPRWDSLAIEGVELLNAIRHARKLKRGALRANRFEVTLRDVVAGRTAIEQRLEALKARGFANYFGAQRFGHEGENVRHAARLLLDDHRYPRHRRGLYLSAARAALFNRVLALRVEDQCWDTPIPGDLMVIAGTNSLFEAPVIDGTTELRCRRFAIHPTGPLPGAPGLVCTGNAARYEDRALSPFSAMCAALATAGVVQSRRPLRGAPTKFIYHWPAPKTLVLGFELPTGCYATTMLAELCNVLAPQAFA